MSVFSSFSFPTLIAGIILGMVLMGLLKDDDEDPDGMA